MRKDEKAKILANEIERKLTRDDICYIAFTGIFFAIVLILGWGACLTDSVVWRWMFAVFYTLMFAFTIVSGFVMFIFKRIRIELYIKRKISPDPRLGEEIGLPHHKNTEEYGNPG